MQQQNNNSAIVPDAVYELFPAMTYEQATYKRPQMGADVFENAGAIPIKEQKQPRSNFAGGLKSETLF